MTPKPVRNYLKKKKKKHLFQRCSIALIMNDSKNFETKDRGIIIHNHTTTTVTTVAVWLPNYSRNDVASESRYRTQVRSRLHETFGGHPTPATTGGRGRHRRVRPHDCRGPDGWCGYMPGVTGNRRLYTLVRGCRTSRGHRDESPVFNNFGPDRAVSSAMRE